MGALSRLRAYLLGFTKANPKHWASMADQFPYDWMGFFPGLTIGTTYVSGYSDPPANTIPIYSPTGVGERDGELYVSNDLAPALTWVWQGGTWNAVSGGGGSGPVPVTSFRGKYDEDADDTGLYREIVGQPFPTSITWYTDAGKGTLVKELLITRDVDQNPTTIQWKFYDSGVLAQTCTDTITYSPGTILEVSRTRSIV